MKPRTIKLLAGFAGFFVCGLEAYGFESTRTLPQGVRNINFKNVTTSMSEKTDADGNTLPLSEPMEKNFTFRHAISGESNPNKVNQIKAFLAKEVGTVDIDDSLGVFSADLNAAVDVFAPVFAFGLTENITVAVATPIYHMTTNAKMSFSPNNAKVEQALGILADDMRQHGNAAEIHSKLNNAVGEIYTKLEDNGFEPLGPWEETGLGDITLAVKHRTYQSDVFTFAYQTGVVLPTGEVDDPDILTDLPRGDGQPDLFFQATFDEPLGNHLMFNQYAKYTYQHKGRKTIRLATELESINVDKAEVDFKLGDKIDAGTSLMWSPPSGYIAGVGAVFHKKYGDRFNKVNDDVEGWITRESEKEATFGEVRVGYSTVQAYQRGDFAVPFSVNLDYKTLISSRNMPLASLITLDFNVFF